MSETDPFSDAAFTGRLQKLLPMLGSAQAAEADTARRKLLEHLSHYRLSLTDLANRLRAGAEPASFFQGSLQSNREMSLERQLAIARAAKQEAAAEAIAASARAHSLEVSLQQSTFEMARLLGSLVRARNWAAAGWIAAALSLAMAILPRVWPAATQNARRPAALTVAPVAIQAQSADPFGVDSTLHAGAGEAAGTAAVQDLPIRMSPNDDANVRAFLNRGERVVIQHRVREGSQTWFEVRSATGVGWVRAGDVIH